MQGALRGRWRQCGAAPLPEDTGRGAARRGRGRRGGGAAARPRAWRRRGPARTQAPPLAAARQTGKSRPRLRAPRRRPPSRRPRGVAAPPRVRTAPQSARLPCWQRRWWLRSVPTTTHMHCARIAASRCNTCHWTYPVHVIITARPASTGGPGNCWHLYAHACTFVTAHSLPWPPPRLEVEACTVSQHTTSTGCGGTPSVGGGVHGWCALMHAAPTRIPAAASLCGELSICGVGAPRQAELTWARPA